jgi:hypothetical protein
MAEADDPRKGGAALRIPPLLGPEHGRLFLCLADEENALAGLKLREMLLLDVVLSLSFLEPDHGQLVDLRERFDCGDERCADRVHERRRRELHATVEAEERDDTDLALKLRDVNVEVHAVDALDFERDMLVENLRDGPW